MVLKKSILFVILFILSGLAFMNKNALAASGQCGVSCALDVNSLNWSCIHASGLGTCTEGVCFQGSGENMAIWYQTTLVGLEPPLNTTPTGWNGCRNAASSGWECLHDCQDITASTHGTCIIEDGGRTLTRSPECSGGYACPATGENCEVCTTAYHGSCWIAVGTGTLLNGCCGSFEPTKDGSSCVCKSNEAVCDVNYYLFPGPCNGTEPGESNCCTSLGYTCEGPDVATGRCQKHTTTGGEITNGKCVLEGGVYKKIGCSGRCPLGSAEGSCEACGDPTSDHGVCKVQPSGGPYAGEIFDSCCPGSVAQRTGAGGCECQPTKDAVYRLFDIIGSVMIPIVIILGMFLIVLKGYGIMNSQGDPAKLQENKEGLTSTIIGLIFVLMAASILRAIIKALISGNSSLL